MPVPPPRLKEKTIMFLLMAPASKKAQNFAKNVRQAFALTPELTENERWDMYCEYPVA